MIPGLKRARTGAAALFGMAAGVLFALAGLAAAGLEEISFGHEHVVDGKAFYHHHFHLGEHEHEGSPPDHDHDHHDHDHHDHGSPVPRRQDMPRRAATFAASPALFHPLGLGTLVQEPAASTFRLPDLPAGGALRPVSLPAEPRGPPFSAAGPDPLV